PVSGLAPTERATLDTITKRLREGFDVFYLVCHGGINPTTSQPFLLLENDAGEPEPVSGSDLVLRIAELWQRPRLVVLASCQSAGTGRQVSATPATVDPDRTEPTGADGSPLAAVGPLLASAGVGAVVAMQGKVTMRTVAEFMPVFFRELCKDGRLDRAMAVGRSAVRDRRDWWMPVLFMRLRSGRIWWYDTGFGQSRGEFARWDSLLGSIRDGRCTPILGPGLTDALVGSRRDIARRLAEANNYPMAAHQREDLPQVAQYLAIKQDPNTSQRKVLQHLCEELISRYHRHFVDTDGVPTAVDSHGLDELASLYERLLQRAWRLRVEDEPAEPHRVLADIPFRLYLTTNPESLLSTAVAAATFEGQPRVPRMEICPWHPDVQAAAAGDSTAGLPPSRATPLIYHLFGRLEVPRSLVITEDDYFDFLIGVTANKELIPPPVRRALADTALLFLGFQLDDWDFRVLFRSIAAQEGRRRRQAYAHIAVQVDPEEGRVQRPEQAREFLNAYFQNADISIYWGTVEDFVKELARQRLVPSPIGG
ncbi:MAG: SIR2 family protein, partial [Vicinamibacterales bacterium]